ncbi:MAG: putative LPS assembly protein LptD [Cytophagales bacterium]
MISLFGQTDSLSLTKNDTTVVAQPDKAKKSAFETTVNYGCEDSIRFDVVNKKVYLFGKAHVNYGQMALKAERIMIDYSKEEVEAKGIINDSSGKYEGYPEFKDKGEVYEMDSIKYHIKSKKAIIYGAATKQGDGYILGEKIKKNPDNELFIRNAVYTTCNHKHPHFGLVVSKIKIIPEKKIITGPGYLMVEGVPTPLVLPFAFFPVPKSRTSGILIPGYGESTEAGFFFSELGFFWAVNDYMGLKVVSDVYTNGGYRSRSTLDYRKRYKYQGALNFDMSDIATGFGRTRTWQGRQYWLIWNHSNVSNLKKGRFTANVNAGSSRFNRQNTTNINQFTQNAVRSSVTYNTPIANGLFNLNSSLQLSQNLSTRESEFTLPQINLSMGQQKPLNNLWSGNKLSLLKNIAVSYNTGLNNRIRSFANEATLGGIRFVGTNPDDEVKTKIERRDSLAIDQMLKNMQFGINHDVRVNSTTRFLKYFNFTPTFNYREVWYDRSLRFSALASDTAVVIDTISGFNRWYQYDFGADVTTTIYGTLFVRKLGIDVIRHVVRPSVGFSTQPNFTDPNIFPFYDQISGTNTNIDRNYSRFQGDAFVFGGPTGRHNQLIRYTIANNIEMKVKNKSDTTKKNKFKKIKLFENISVNGNYDMAKDTLKWSDIVLNASTMFFNRFNINTTMSFDPYVYENTSSDPARPTNIKTNELLWDKLGQPAALKGMNLAASTSLNPNWKHKTTYSPEMETFLAFNPHLRYMDFSLPWNASLSYNYIYNQIGLAPKTVTQTINISGDVKLTETWRVNIVTGYDIVQKKGTATNMNIFKDLHCWIMNFSWSPFSPFMTYMFRINVKSPTLRDLKLERNPRLN